MAIEEMPNLVSIRALKNVTPTIRPLFDGVQKGYFNTNNLPSELLDLPTPDLKDYLISIHSTVPNRKDKRIQLLRIPTLSETLWAIGFMNISLASVVSFKAVRFMHKPIEGKQIVVRLVDTSYVIELLPRKTNLDIQFAYVRQL